MPMQKVTIYGTHREELSVWDIATYDFSDAEAYLPDGDRIVIPPKDDRSRPGVVDNPDKDAMTFNLQTAPGMWWKAIDLVDGATRTVMGGTRLESANGAKSAWTRIDLGQGAPGVFILFSKAKEFGVHRPIYLIAAGSVYTPWDPTLKGKGFTFYWAHDNG